MVWNKAHGAVTHIRLTSPSAVSTALPVCLAWTPAQYKRKQSWGNSLEKPLQFSSMLVKLQKRSQRGTSVHSYQSNTAILLVCLSTLLPAVIGIIVRLELRTNWASSWRAWAVSLKGHVSGGAPGDTEHEACWSDSSPDKMAVSYLHSAYERLMPSPWQILCLITVGFAQIQQNRGSQKDNVLHIASSYTVSWCLCVICSNFRKNTSGLRTHWRISVGQLSCAPVLLLLEPQYSVVWEQASIILIICSEYLIW